MGMIVQRHAPRTLEEGIVGYLELKEDCVQTATIPPPDSCGPAVTGTYAVLQFHPITLVIALAFIGMLLKLALSAHKD